MECGTIDHRSGGTATSLGSETRRRSRSARRVSQEDCPTEFEEIIFLFDDLNFPINE